MNLRPLLILSAIALSLSGCATYQTGQRTIEMAASISRIRETQVLNNIAASLNNRSAVPSQITLTVGQANVTAGFGSGMLAPGINKPATPLEIDISPSNSWTTQWQFSSVTDQDDLRLLRNIYALVVATDEQFDELTQYFAHKKELKKPNNNPDASHNQVYSGFLGEFLPEDETKQQSDQIHIIPWTKAKEYIEQGDSIGCRMYQKDFVYSGKGIPFKRWLYWRHSGDREWLPRNSAGTTIPNDSITSLGLYDGWELGVLTQARGCFDDFVILVQGFTPATNASASSGTKIMLPH